MIIELSYKGIAYKCNLQKPIDISIPTGQVKCFYAPDFKSSPVVSRDFIGSVIDGGPVNFYNVHFNPHGNGTHTECLGHITRDQESINNHLQKFHFIALLSTIEIDQKKNGDSVISLKKLKQACPTEFPEALIIRTIPNNKDKLSMDYSGMNPPYLEKEATLFLVDHGVQHLLIDLPSVDQEKDGGLLQSHRIFWNIVDETHENNPRNNCTITEMIYVDTMISDGLYLLNIQIAPFNLDAAPSKPVIYELYV